MEFPKKMYPHLYELEKMEFETQQDSWLFRRDYKHELWKEYQHRLDFIEHRIFILGGNNKIHKLDAVNNTQQG